MKNILDDIIADKRKEVVEKKEKIPLSLLRQHPSYLIERRSLKKNLLLSGSNGIIAEFKRKSPSKGIINASADIVSVVSRYSEYASGVSILTDEKYFGGKSEDILSVRAYIEVPVLRKDFIIDEYQVEEAKAIGADVILLIAACLSPAEVRRLGQKAKELSMEVLLEIHHEGELDCICDEIDLIGINNRNLKTFEVDVENSLKLLAQLPKGKPAVAESGIASVDDYKRLKDAGFKGFLMGEFFMKKEDPGMELQNFIRQLNLIQI